MKKSERCRVKPPKATKFGMTRKLAAVILGAALVFTGLAGCSSGDDDSVSYIGTKAPSKEKAVGDIVFSDGSATPYKDGLNLTEAQKNAAIAIIFYKGTDLNSGSDTTTVRTLGVGLKRSQTTLAWCTESANAYNTNITTIQIGDKNGSDNLEQIGDYLADKGKTDDTGTAENYPAFYFAKNYGTTNSLSDTYKDGWYLPSSSELNQIYKNGKGTDKVFDIDEAIVLCGGDKFDGDSYWSSSQSNITNIYAWGLNFNNDGKWDNKDKGSTNDCYVCAVREF